MKSNLKNIYGEFKKLLKDNRSGFIKKLKNEIPQFKVVFDVGTFTGKVIDEILAINGETNIHAFEPFSGSFEILEAKYCAAKNITLNHCAVSDKAGRQSFHVNSFKETNSLLESATVSDVIDAFTEEVKTEEVEIISIGEYCVNKNIELIDFIKIDTQGNSYQVLKGMEKLLHKKKVSYLYVEAEFIEMYKGEKLFSEIETLMRSHGYFIMGLYNLNYVNNHLAWCDVLFSSK